MTLVRHRLGGGVEDWLVHVGGFVVVLRTVPGFFWWRRCGGKEERAIGLGKNIW